MATKKMVKKNESILSELITEKAKLQMRVDELMSDPAFRRLAEVDKEIYAIVDSTLADDASEEFIGKRGEVLQVGARALVRTVTDMPMVAKMLNAIMDGLFLEKASVPLSVVDDYLTPEQREQVLKVERNGKRRIKLK